MNLYKLIGLVAPLFIFCRAMALGAGGGIGLGSQALHDSFLERLIVTVFRKSKALSSPG